MAIQDRKATPHLFGLPLEQKIRFLDQRGCSQQRRRKERKARQSKCSSEYAIIRGCTNRKAFMQASPSTLGPLQTVWLFGWIALGSILIGAVLPGCIAYRDGVFFYDGTVARVKSKKLEVANVLREADSNEARLRQQISEIDKKLLVGNIPQDSATTLFGLRQSYLADIQAPSLSVQPFYGHILMYFWPIMYCGLGTAILILGPKLKAMRASDIIVGRTVWNAIVIVLAFLGPFYFRVFFTSNLTSGRRVYAYPNPDISITSFVMQSLNFIVMSLLLAIVWTQWSSIAVSQRSRLAPLVNSSTVSVEIIAELSRQFYCAQFSFVAVSVGFVMYTAVFWIQIIKNGDGRFWYEGIVAHAIWFISIGITAMPMVVSWNAWREHRLRLIMKLFDASNASPENLRERIDSIRSLGPVSNWSLILSAAGIIVTLIGPFIHAHVK